MMSQHTNKGQGSPSNASKGNEQGAPEDQSGMTSAQVWAETTRIATATPIRACSTTLRAMHSAPKLAGTKMPRLSRVRSAKAWASVGPGGAIPTTSMPTIRVTLATAMALPLKRRRVWRFYTGVMANPGEHHFSG